jgi:anaerobic dimethyl sulfoxide reductase subunit B (iron-sulfur subunit)
LRYGFTFDASACTGCKACQVACKDRNALPDGVLWRRVYEVSGGAWERSGAAWTNTVFAYNVSVGCNHCVDPACAASCPTGAYVVREDGIVWLDTNKCVGCGYCGWACPYGAPQYSPQRGHTSKCDFCRDLIDEGRSPVCVAACPLRALNYVEVQAAPETQGTEVQSLPLWELPETKHPFPLPTTSRTRPLVAVKPHPAMFNELRKAVANTEEVRPAERKAASMRLGMDTRELPLVAFTLLGQAAAGVAVISWFTQPLSGPLLAVAGVLISAAVLVSLLHLGTASNAWRTAANVKRSALSREVLALASFGLASALAIVAPGVGRVALGVTGIALVFSMATVYQLDSVPGWKTWRTHAAFATSALLLGAMMITFIHWSAQPVPFWLVVVIGSSLFVQQFVTRRRFYERLRHKAM